MLQAKTEEQKEHIGEILTYFDHDWIDNEDVGAYGRGRITYEQMAKIVDYLRGDTLIIDLSTKEKFDESGKVLQFETANNLSKSLWKNCEQEIARFEEYNRLLEENRKLHNAYDNVKKEYDALKEKTKNLPRIATLNKRIHALKERLKKYEEI